MRKLARGLDPQKRSQSRGGIGNRDGAGRSM